MWANAVENAAVTEPETTQNFAEREEYSRHMFAFALADSAACIASTLDLEVVMQRILINVGRVVPNESANIMLIEGETAHIRYWKGFPAEYAEFFRITQFSLETENLKTMLQTRAPVIINNTDLYDAWIRCAPQGKCVNAYLGVPIKVYQQVIGFLNLGSKQVGFFTPTHAELLQAFADQAAIAIANAQHYERLQQHTIELEQRITQRTAELLYAYERLQELDWLKSKFISDVSHELRTPVTTLNLRTHLLEHDKPEKQADHLAALKKDLHRLNELIEGIFEFSHLETTKSALIFDQIDLNEIVHEVIDNYRETATMTGLYMAFEPCPYTRIICGNRTSLKQVVISLVTNALRYTAHGGVYLKTEICSSSDQLCLTVQDTGMGIDPDDMPHLFDRFYRGKHVGSSNIPGAGLGLSFVKEILELHHGRIEIESSGGTTIRVWLPLTDTSFCQTSTCNKRCWVHAQLD